MKSVQGRRSRAQRDGWQQGSPGVVRQGSQGRHGQPERREDGTPGAADPTRAPGQAVRAQGVVQVSYASPIIP